MGAWEDEGGSPGLLRGVLEQRSSLVAPVVPSKWLSSGEEGLRLLSAMLAVTIIEPPRGEAGGLVSSFVVVDPPGIDERKR